MGAQTLRSYLVATALVLLAVAPARAELRISDLDVFLNDHEVTVHVVLLWALPEGFQEGIQSGVPTHIRLVVELWQYLRRLPHRLLVSKTIERPPDYHLVTKAFKRAAAASEAPR